MISLAIETSTFIQSLALARDYQLLDHVQQLAKKGHAQRLAKTVHNSLFRHGISYEEIDELIVGIGPGSFTGLRIGLAFAKGLAFATKTPIRPVSSIESIASILPSGGNLLVGIDARKTEVYGGLYSTGPETKTILATNTWDPKKLVEAALLLQLQGPIWMAGNGIEIYKDSFKNIDGEHLSETLSSPSAPALIRYYARRQKAEQTAIPIGSIEPIYIRLSEAEIGLKKRELKKRELDRKL